MAINIPNSNVPVIGTNGLMSVDWYRFFNDLARQLGDIQYGDWTPAFTAGSGTLTTTGSYSGAYWKRGRAVWIVGQGTITTNGTGATNIVVSGLPFVADEDAIINGRNDVTSGAQLQGIIAASGSTITLVTYNNTYPGGTGAVLSFSGCYRTAA